MGFQAGELIKKPLVQASEFARKHDTTFLNLTNAANTAVGCLGLITAIQTNKNIPEKDKPYMTAQEFTGGLLNFFICFGASALFTKGGVELVKRHLITPTLRQAGKKLSLQETKTSIDKFFQATKKDVFSPTGLSNEVENGIRNTVKGASIGSMLLGSIFAYNIAVPILRNKMAGKIENNKEQKYSLYKRRQDLNPQSLLNKNKTFLSKTAKSLKQSYYTAYTGGMKI